MSSEINQKKMLLLNMFCGFSTFSMYQDGIMQKQLHTMANMPAAELSAGV
jgi:hypothetical protein